MEDLMKNSMGRSELLVAVVVLAIVYLGMLAQNKTASETHKTVTPGELKWTPNYFRMGDCRRFR
jgi:ABC-type proline/glycine betaine transport system substrate-binding protein